MLCLVALSVLVTCVLAQEPHPCESPKQFEGRFSVFDRERKFEVFGRFAYDDIQRRFRELEEIEIGQERDYFDKLFLHNVGLEFKLNLKTRQCNVTTLTRPFIPFAVPADARFRGSATIGAAGVPDEHVSINLFDGTFEGNPYFAVVSHPDCIPIDTGFFSNQTGAVHRDFYDISLGIRDPDVFIPPPECHT